MHKGKRGVLFVFSGPSGVGKGTLKAKLFEEFADRIAYSVSPFMQRGAGRAKARWTERITFSSPGRSLNGA